MFAAVVLTTLVVMGVVIGVVRSKRAGGSDITTISNPFATDRKDK